MTWTPVTQDQMEMARHVVRYIDVARKKYGEGWLPTDADLSKSALLERLRSGKEPLTEPPPLGLSCPWYALIEDAGPHYVFEVHRGDGSSYFPKDIMSVLQHGYKILEEAEGGKCFILRDAVEPKTSYRFRLWYDADWVHPSGRIKGGWFIQNKAFEVAAAR